MIVDSHCHLDFSNLFNQLDDVVKRAKDKNVETLLTICTTLDSFEKIKLIIAKYNNIYGTFGIHPHETSKYKDINSKFIIDIKNNNQKIIGIGETGLDFFYNYSDKKIQTKMFEEHIFAASELKIPLIVHTRNAETETIDILKNASKDLNLKVLIHCFTGTAEFAKKLLNLNCYISVSGIITFKKSEKLLEAVSEIPLDKLLVETDSPYLSPEPLRGKSNEPSHIIHTIDKLSQIKKTSASAIINSTTSNFKNLFNL